MAEKKKAAKARPRRAKAAKTEAPAPEPKVEAPAKEGAKPVTHTARKKPKLTEAQRLALLLRRRIADRRPTFLRQEWFRHPRLGMIWRKPKGDHSKLRTHERWRINSPSIGFRGPAAVRGLHPSGFSEVLVHNPRQLEGLNPASQAVRVAGGVGLRKRALIVAAAEEKGLRVLNPGVGA